MNVKKFILKKNDLDEERSIVIPFTSATKQEPHLNDKILNIRENVINDIINYERIKLHPTNNDGSILNEITYSLFFLNPLGMWDEEVSNISRVGFTLNDILNRTNALKNSFLRITVFDSDNLKTQNLIYTTTMYLNIDKLYDTYVETNGDINKMKLFFSADNPLYSNN